MRKWIAVILMAVTFLTFFGCGYSQSPDYPEQVGPVFYSSDGTALY